MLSGHELCLNALTLAGKTTYLTPRGPGTLFPGAQGIKLQDIKDGTSNTIFVVDVNDASAVTWTRPDDWQATPPLDVQALIGHHLGQIVAGLADGSVRAFPDKVAPRLLQTLTTRDGGEPFSWDDL